MGNKTILNQTEGFQVTPKYSVIQTQDVINALTNKGFKLEKLVETRPRTKERIGFQKHMVRMSHPDLALKNVGDSRPEIVLVNSYDGSTSLQMKFGIFRLVCSNGLVVGKNLFSHNVRHVGDIAARLIEGLDYMAKQVHVVGERIESFKAMQVPLQRKTEYIAEALQLIIPEDGISSVNLSRVDLALRIEDQNDTLWHLFNRIQEKVLNGGIQYRTVTEQNEIKYHSTRRIKAISRTVEVNQALWDLTEKYAT